ncbi:MAG TPA: alpha/beta hydrolase [Gemmatimonadaceae bacterium]|nr:alpha/beta hydrolase [Gemmatimonadaceae bacterium]
MTNSPFGSSNDSIGMRIVRKLHCPFGHRNPDGLSQRDRVSRLFVLTAATLLVVYVGLLLALWRYQERVVFQPPRRPGLGDVSARRASYHAPDGVALHAYVIGDCALDNTCLLVFHGNAEVARWLIPWAARVHADTGSCVVLAEYRGYDGLAGVPSYESSAHDARAALAYVRDALNVEPSRIVYFGHSLGTAIAAELAAEMPPRALVLQSPFSSAREMAKRLILPGLGAFWGAISRVHFDTVARVGSLSCPVFVAHGDRDLIIPVRMGRAVFDAAREPGELLIVRGAGHNDVPEVGGAEYRAWFGRALRAGAS